MIPLSADLKNNLLSIRRSLRSAATRLERAIIAGQTPGGAWPAIQKQLPSVRRECRAVADLIDDWVRSDRAPTPAEWASFMRRMDDLCVTTNTLQGRAEAPPKLKVIDGGAA
jgi:hypothetical protein